MNDNQVKPITDKPITVRIPLDLLENIESKAGDRYPSRKGTGGNRSQLILDALVFYQSHQWGEDEDSLQSTQGTQEAIKDEVKKLIDDNVHDVIQKSVSEQLEGLKDNLEDLIDKAVEKRLQSTQSNTSNNGNIQNVQNINNENTTVQSTQDNTEDNPAIQSVQDNTENNPSEDSLEGASNKIQEQSPQEENKPVIKAINEGSRESEDNEKPKTPIEKRIKSDRTDEGLTDKKLSALLKKMDRGVSYQTVNKWRNGKSNPSGKNENLFDEWEVRDDRWFRSS